MAQVSTLKTTPPLLFSLPRIPALFSGDFHPSESLGPSRFDVWIILASNSVTLSRIRVLSDDRHVTSHKQHFCEPPVIVTCCFRQDVIFQASQELSPKDDLPDFLLILFFDCPDCRHVPPRLIYGLLRTASRTLWMLAKCSPS